MSAAARPGRALPVRRPADVALVLFVAADAAQTVRGRLKGVTSVEELPPGPRDNMPRFRVSIAKPAPEKGTPGGLTPREVEVLQRAALGLENKEIAGELFLSVETVRTHMKSILRKLDAINRAHAVHLAHVAGILGDSVSAKDDGHSSRDCET